MEKTQSPKDKISKIAKIEGSQKAQKIIAKAPQTSSSKTASKKSSTKTSRVATKAKKPRTLTKATAKQAIKKVAKGIKKDLSFRVDEKSLAKIEAFFKDFAKKAEDKSAFIEEAVLKHIKKTAKKGKVKLKKLKKS